MTEGEERGMACDTAPEPSASVGTTRHDIDTIKGRTHR